MPPGALRRAAGEVLRVLLIEDAALIRDAVTEMIEACGRARVAFATDSEAEALQALGAAPYDVVIVDLQLRDGTGFGVLRALQGARCEALVIVLTNYPSRANRHRCAELGVTYFLDKSSEFEQVPLLMLDWARRRGIRWDRPPGAS